MYEKKKLKFIVPCEAISSSREAGCHRPHVWAGTTILRVVLPALCVVNPSPKRNFGTHGPPYQWNWTNYKTGHWAGVNNQKNYIQVSSASRSSPQTSRIQKNSVPPSPEHAARDQLRPSSLSMGRPKSTSVLYQLDPATDDYRPPEYGRKQLSDQWGVQDSK